ncbi:hypothetical protein TPR58_22240 [Sphingomonas sp. HF-S3]|uniref:Uncharacterized protein n=1 Tax=Sphingomonas rustica TaxID=3103142 RepID=A0ABV0BEC5_9SPHN
MRAIEVRWDDRDQLSFYTGCHGAENAPIHAALTRAEGLIPVAALVGGTGAAD